MSFLYSIIGFLLAIGVLVAVHEFGHFWVARKLGVKVLRYSIGFGKPLWKKVSGEDQIEYVVAAIPLGGYVKMLGENDPDTPVAPEEAHRAFDNQPIWKRALIVVAGPGINFLFAILLFAILGLQSQQNLTPRLGDVPADSIIAQAGIGAGDSLRSVDGKAVSYFGEHDLYLFNRVLAGKDVDLQFSQQNQQTKSVNLAAKSIAIYNINPSSLSRSVGLVPVFREATTKIAEVVPDSAAAQAGLQIGDKIVAANRQKLDGWAELVQAISLSPDQDLELTVERDGVQQVVNARPTSISIGEQTMGRLGIAPRVLPYAEADLVDTNRSLFEAISYGAQQTWLMSSVTLRMLWKMVAGQVSHKNINGPITIAEVTGQAIQLGLDYYLNILAIISISLGVMNLLPIPMLDGGHLMMYAVELVAGKSISEKVYAVGQRIGIVLLICLMSLAFYNDIFRLLN